MSTPSFQLERITPLNERPIRQGKFVLYWMQASQRTDFNHALEYAVTQANELKQPLITAFGLTDKYPEANWRHYQFMLEGLRETQAALEKRGIPLIVRRAAPDAAALQIGAAASFIVTDAGYLRQPRRWRQKVARQAQCRVVQVESDLIVPLTTASKKEEYSAATFRRKIQGQIERFLFPVEKVPLAHDGLDLARRLDSEKIDEKLSILQKMKLDRSVTPSPLFKGGAKNAAALLDDFLRHKLDHYAQKRSDPLAEAESNLSPYLHFGQISPVQIALAVKKSKAAEANKHSFLEELIVRRELAFNFVYYHPHYDDYSCLPNWAAASLEKHAGDRREYVYKIEELEAGATYDPYFNAAQRQMTTTGKMHNYLRMYWGKKIIEWSPTPQAAFSAALYLNNKYQLDGRDPCSFAGVAWCFGKHDRPWAERPIFGLVRYMNAAGLKRKFNIDKYVHRYC